ncbi:uncharacterized protein LOC111911683 [Lactuca sativa]|uniref:Uncharacterized protein n=1 Tax=Lactuca sativa TaxID=4236 RepID=A0A9R1UFB0_LACSA|nr:uncharacterized protein LOC111911683 [Lactuca sativa]KAJ0186033.1 hypothetical protein LSAT_V11C900486520 [Lactuca sativa]
MASSFLTCSLSSFPKVSCQRFDPLSSSSSSTTVTTSSRLSLERSVVAGGRVSLANRSYLSSGHRTSQHDKRSKMEFVVYSADQVADLLPFGIHLPENWPAWIPGVVLAVVVPFFTNKWGPFSKFKEELDKVEEAVDNVADRVDEIAEKVEEFVGDIADDLPEGSQLRQSLEKVEKVADTIGDKAKMVSDLVDKMDEMEAKLENIMDKAKEKKNTTPTKTEPQ